MVLLHSSEGTTPARLMQLRWLQGTADFLVSNGQLSRAALINPPL